jgi:REP element-mobilizing transposase RayT
VFARGSNRGLIFAFDSDRVDFLQFVERVIERYELRCLTYCLMPNHYHLVVETPDDRLSTAMRVLNGRYALRFNRRYGRDAHLFKNRFGAVLQESDAQLFATLRYVVRNPVDAGLCSDPNDWPWSSSRALTGLEPGPAFLNVSHTLSYFANEPERGMAAYRELISTPALPIGV